MGGLHNKNKAKRERKNLRSCMGFRTTLTPQREQNGLGDQQLLLKSNLGLSFNYSRNIYGLLMMFQSTMRMRT